MDGMIKYSEREKRALKGETTEVEYGDAEEFVSMLQTGKLEF